MLGGLEHRHRTLQELAEWGFGIGCWRQHPAVIGLGGRHPFSSPVRPRCGVLSHQILDSSPDCNECAPARIGARPAIVEVTEIPGLVRLDRARRKGRRPRDRHAPATPARHATGDEPSRVGRHAADSAASSSGEPGIAVPARLRNELPRTTALRACTPLIQPHQRALPEIGGEIPWRGHRRWVSLKNVLQDFATFSGRVELDRWAGGGVGCRNGVQVPEGAGTPVVSRAPRC